MEKKNSARVFFFFYSQYEAQEPLKLKEVTESGCFMDIRGGSSYDYKVIQDR